LIHDGKTPLHTVMNSWESHNDVEIMKLLLSQPNVDVNHVDIEGNTLLHLACANISNIPFSIFELLIEVYHGDVNRQDQFGNTPIHLAIEGFQDEKDIKKLKLLLKQPNFDFYLCTNQAESILHTACGQVSHLPKEIFVELIETHH